MFLNKDSRARQILTFFGTAIEDVSPRAKGPLAYVPEARNLQSAVAVHVPFESPKLQRHHPNKPQKEVA